MSEVLPPEEDPDPLPSTGSNWLPHEASGLRAIDSGWIEPGYEREKIIDLCTLADDIIATRNGFVDDTEEDISAVLDGILLRRFIPPDTDIRHYIFVQDFKDGPRYCRAWTEQSERVNWCLEEQRFEQAERVYARIEQCFADTAVVTRKRFGSKVLAKLLRRNPNTSL